MLNPFFAAFDTQERNDDWVRRLRRYRRIWISISALAILALVVLQLQIGFVVNPLILFLLAALVVVNMVLAEMVDSRIEGYFSDQLMNQVSEEEARARFAKIGFEDYRRKGDDDE